MLHRTNLNFAAINASGSAYIRQAPAQLSSGAPGLQHRRRRSGGEVLGGFSDFLECAGFDLPDAFTRYVELFREIFERQRFVDQMSGFEDAAFAAVQNLDRGNQGLMLVLLVVVLDDDGFRRG